MDKVKPSIEQVINGLEKFLLEKNRRYGNSALAPINVFTKHLSKDDGTLNGLLSRLDDKLSRIKNAKSLKKNDVVDLTGYLVLLCTHKDWKDFSEFID